MNKGTLMAVGSGGLSALASLAVLFGVPGSVMLGCLAPLPLFLVGLSMGVSMVGIAGAAGVTTAAALGGVAAGLVYGGMHALPCWFLVYQALRRQFAETEAATWYPIGRLITALAILSCIVLAGLAVLGLTNDRPLHEAIGTLLSQVVDQAAPGYSDAERQTFVDFLTPVFPGFTAATWQLMVVANGMLAQTMVVRRGWNLRPKPDWSDFRLPDWISWPLAGSAAIALVGNGDVHYIAVNLFLVLLVPFFLQGLATIHRLLKDRPARVPTLVTFYIMLFMFFMIVGVVIAGLGMIDQWMDHGIGRRSRAKDERSS